MYRHSLYDQRFIYFYYLIINLISIVVSGKTRFTTRILNAFLRKYTPLCDIEKVCNVLVKPVVYALIAFATVFYIIQGHVLLISR